MDSVLKDPAATVFLCDFADFSVTYEIKFWIDDLGQRNPVSSEVRRRIWYAFRRSHIQIPFPVREVHIKREEPDRIPGEEMAAALKGNHVLQTLDDPQFRKLLEKMECQRYGRGEVIIREGESASDFYHILRGECQVLKENRPLARLHDGDFFGEISLVTGEKTTATVVTTTESEIIQISSPVFRETVSMNTKMARKLSEVITLRQAELRIFHEKIVESDSGILKEKTDNLFRRIVKYFGVKN
jgi:CRP-like cAMP-binding protein